MKKFFFVATFLSIIEIFAFAKPFTADFRLVTTSKKQIKAIFDKVHPPFLAVYQKKGKTLVLLAAKHGQDSLPAVQYAFDEYYPKVALIEREFGFPLQNCQESEDAYTAALSAKNGIPLVRTDADYEKQWIYVKDHGFLYEDFQMFWIIKNADGVSKHEHKQPTASEEIKNYKRDVHNSAWGELFTEKRLLEYFKQHYHMNFNSTDFIQLRLDLQNTSPQKWVKETPFYKMMYGQPDVRSMSMLQNITAALNEYEVVFSEMGAGHFADIHKALQKMLGKPHYITIDQIPPQTLWKDCTLEGLKEIVLVP